jgi:hypothetical protein
MILASVCEPSHHDLGEVASCGGQGSATGDGLYDQELCDKFESWKGKGIVSQLSDENSRGSESNHIHAGSGSWKKSNGSGGHRQSARRTSCVSLDSDVGEWDVELLPLRTLAEIRNKSESMCATHLKGIFFDKLVTFVED